MGWQSKVYWASVVIMPYFSATGLQLLRCSELTAFSFKWRPSAILDFKKLEILTAGLVRNFGKPTCKIWRYGNMAVFRLFQNGGRPPSLISKSSNFWLSIRFRAPMCFTKPNFVPIGRNFAEMWPMFNFFEWRPSTILDLFNVYLDHLQRVFVGLCHCAKCVWNRCSTFDNMRVLMFCKFCLKMPIYALFGRFYPIDGIQYQPILQRLNLRVIAVPSVYYSCWYL